MSTFLFIQSSLAAFVAVFALSTSLFAAPLATPGGTKCKTIDLDAAERIALAHVPGGVVESSGRDRELGRLVFEVEVRDRDGRDHDITVDACDGKILAEEIDD